MPEPDPQHPQPRLVSAARWLLLLLPSAIVISTLAITLRMEVNGEAAGMRLAMISFVVIAVAVILCFALGFLVKKWRHGRINSVVWAFNYGFMILFGNGCILFLFLRGFIGLV